MIRSINLTLSFIFLIGLQKVSAQKNRYPFNADAYITVDLAAGLKAFVGTFANADGTCIIKMSESNARDVFVIRITKLDSGKKTKKVLRLSMRNFISDEKLATTVFKDPSTGKSVRLKMILKENELLEFITSNFLNEERYDSSYFSEGMSYKRLRN